MLTVKTTGDDAWDTDRRIIDNLIDYRVRLTEPGGATFEGEIRGSTNDGRMVVGLTEDGDDDAFIDPHNLTIEVL